MSHLYSKAAPTTWYIIVIPCPFEVKIMQPFFLRSFPNETFPFSNVHQFGLLLFWYFV